MNKMRYTFFLLVITTLFASGVNVCVQAADSAGAQSKVAVVNGKVITREDLDREMSVARKRYARMGRTLAGPEVPKMEARVLESLIDRELLYQEAVKSGIHIDDQTVNNELTTLKKRFSNEAAFQKALRDADLSEADVQTQIRRGMTIQKFIDDRFVNKISVTPKEVKSYYDNHRQMFTRPEEVRASHILIKVDPKADEKTKLKARRELEGIQKKLLAGEDFAALARKYSQGPSAARGGDLGYFRRGQMVPPFEKAAFSLKTGEVSDIVVTRFGYHLIKVTGRKPAGIIPYEKVKDKLGEFLKEQKVRKAIDLHMEELKKDAKIERLLATAPEKQ